MIVLSGAHLVLPDRMLTPGTLVVDGDRIVDVRPGTGSGPLAGGHAPPPFAFHGHYIVPGFIDVHVHGVDGVDSLDGGEAIALMAVKLPRYGVTAFCPTTVACAPDALHRVLEQVRRARETPVARAARVLPAHLESNFLNPEFRGAQPLRCLRSPRAALGNTWRPVKAGHHGPAEAGHYVPTRDVREEEFAAADLLREIERAAPDVGIVTLAPELDGGIDLIRWLSSRSYHVSLGHSGATYEQGLEAIAAKHPSRILAITDGTAASGLPTGARASLGGQPITAGESAAFLDDGTMAGSVLTMDRAFQILVGKIGLSLVDAAAVCSTTPARELGLVGHGIIAADAIADLAVLDAQLTVVQTYVGGQLAYSRT